LSLPRIAIIGAGIAGLTLASALQSHAEVVIVDKSRGVGGRMATRRSGDFSFDHGAQFFTARSEAFQTFLQPWLAAGIVQPWHPRLVSLATGTVQPLREWHEPHYIGAPSMTALPKALAATLAPKLQWEVARMRRVDGQWWLYAADGMHLGPFDWVVATAPAPQITQWFAPEFSGMAALQQVRYAPCMALMLGYDALPTLPWEVARITASSIALIVRGDRKAPHGLPSLLLHSTAEFASAYWDADPQQLALLMQQELESLLDAALPAPSVSLLHRWRYAAAIDTTPTPYEFDAANRLAACGDWTSCSAVANGGTRVEAAFTSARALADQLLALPELSACARAV
jgi:renalase